MSNNCDKKGALNIFDALAGESNSFDMDYVEKYKNDLLDKRFIDVEELEKKFDGSNLKALLLAATYIGQTYELNRPKVNNTHVCKSFKVRDGLFFCNECGKSTKEIKHSGN